MEEVGMPECIIDILSNGQCDPANNFKECGFDGGDCINVQGLKFQ